MTTSVIEVGDQKFWTIFRHWFDFSDRHIGSHFCAFTLSLATNFFYFGHQIFGVDGQFFFLALEFPVIGKF
jgi:hypothetical protein